MTELDKRAEAYMRSVMDGNDGDVFTRSDLYEYIIDAYKQGYNDRGFAIRVKPECLKRDPVMLGSLYGDEPVIYKDIKDLSATELRHLSENGYSVSEEIERRIKQKHNDKQDV